MVDLPAGRQGGSQYMYYVYVLKSLKDNKKYTGITVNLERRIRDHNSGKNVSTKSRRPFVLIYSEVRTDRILARKRKKYLKSGIGRQKISTS